MVGRDKGGEGWGGGGDPRSAASPFLSQASTLAIRESPKGWALTANVCEIRGRPMTVLYVWSNRNLKFKTLNPKT